MRLLRRADVPAALLTTVLLLVGPLASTASAITLEFSDVVSQQPYLANDGFDCGTAGHDPCITADQLAGSVTFDVTAPTTLEITLENQATNELTITELYFSVSSAVTGLSLLTVTHSVEGALAVPGVWSLFSSTGQGGPTHSDGMGIHDYALKDGVGMAAEKIGVGESVVFELAISGTGPYTDSDFVNLSEQTPTMDQTLTYAAARWTNGDGSSLFPYGDNDSGFGGVVPEPSTAVLLSLGLLALGARRRRDA